MKDDVKTSYRLVEMQASNFLILKTVTIRPDRSVFRISGQNGMGKSSVLSIVSAAIGGAKLCPKQAIRKGETEGMVSADFGALKATRRFRLRDDGTETSDLTVEFANGKRPRKPQEILDELRGSAFADDPLAFSRLSQKARYDLLKNLVPGFDFDAQAKIRQDLFDDRTQVGRDFDRANAAAESIDVPVGAAATLVDVTELAAELRAAGEHNSTIDNRKQRREEVAERIEALRDEADRLMAEAKAKESEASGLEEKLRGAEPLPAKIDTAEIERKIAGAEVLNAGARKRADKAARKAEADAMDTEYASMTTRIAAIDAAKVAAIEKAKLPVPELSFGDEDILLDNLPFDQASTARKIRVSTALLMALKPELRVLLIREGSLLDDAARAALEADAEANNFVVLLETVGDGDGAGGITIVDGEIA